MARYPAIAATSSAVLDLLESSLPTDGAQPDIAWQDVAFTLLSSADLQNSNPERQAVSLYLYHVNINASRRSAPGRLDPTGARRPPVLPLDLHYLLIAWAKAAATQQALLGWAVRTLQDTSTLPASLLNAGQPQPVFEPDESVELVWENLSHQDVFDVWEVARSRQQPCAAYVARIVEIESDAVGEDLPTVQVRDLRYAGAKPS
jgi:hypothetical protein